MYELEGKGTKAKAHLLKKNGLLLKYEGWILAP